MCGRFALYSAYPRLSRALRLPLEEGGAPTPRDNVAPGTWISVVRHPGADARLVMDEASLAPWLDPLLTERETLRQLVHHLAAGRLIHWPVSTRVNRPGSEGAELLTPVPG